MATILDGVTISSVSNIYGASADGIRELFSEYVEGNDANVALALSASPLSKDAANALEKSFEAFGYGEGACTFATLQPAGQHEGALLDDNALFLLIEGLDPICIVVADNAARAAVERAYRCKVAADGPSRVFGRSAAVFADLSKLVSTSEGKQKAWAILKTLPRKSG